MTEQSPLSTEQRDNALALQKADIERWIAELPVDWHKLGDERYNQAFKLLHKRLAEIDAQIALYQRSR